MKTDEELVNECGCEIDDLGHAWGGGWQDDGKLHPGFGTMGGYVDQCFKCGMYSYELKGQTCGPLVRELK